MNPIIRREDFASTPCSNRLALWILRLTGGMKLSMALLFWPIITPYYLQLLVWKYVEDIWEETIPSKLFEGSPDGGYTTLVKARYRYVRQVRKLLKATP